MSEYHRLFVKGGTYFFTVVTYDRQPLLCEEPALIRLKAAFRGSVAAEVDPEKYITGELPAPS